MTTNSLNLTNSVYLRAGQQIIKRVGTADGVVEKLRLGGEGGVTLAPARLQFTGTVAAFVGHVGSVGVGIYVQRYTAEVDVIVSRAGLQSVGYKRACHNSVEIAAFVKDILGI